MRVLLVGAGAVGQVLGQHLSKGGAQVSVLLRPDRQIPADGFRLHRLRAGRQPLSATWLPDQVSPEPAALSAVRWDAVLLCVPSVALRSGWLAEVAAQVGAATIVSIGQDPADRATLLGVWPGRQVVQATPGLLAYHAPLTAVDRIRSGIAYWLPPGPSLTFAGAAERVRPLMEIFSSGGLRAGQVPVGSGELRAALTIPYVARLATVDWSVRELRQHLALPARAAHEAAVVVAAMHSMARPGRLGSCVPLVSSALWVLPFLVPFDLHAYLRRHFSKMSGQTAQMLAGWVAAGRARALPVDSLAELALARVGDLDEPGRRRSSGCGFSRSNRGEPASWPADR